MLKKTSSLFGIALALLVTSFQAEASDRTITLTIANLTGHTIGVPYLIYRTHSDGGDLEHTYAKGSFENVVDGKTRTVSVTQVGSGYTPIAAIDPYYVEGNFSAYGHCEKSFQKNELRMEIYVDGNGNYSCKYF